MDHFDEEVTLACLKIQKVQRGRQARNEVEGRLRKARRSTYNDDDDGGAVGEGVNDGIVMGQL